MSERRKTKMPAPAIEPKAKLRKKGTDVEDVTFRMLQGKRVGKVPVRSMIEAQAQLGPMTVQREAPKAPDPNKRLNQKERKFVEIMLANDGKIVPSEAAKMAGYPRTSAAVKARELLHPDFSPHVVRVFRAAMAEQEDRVRVSRFRHLRDLQEIRDKALEAGSYSAAVQAEYRRGQAAEDPIYVQRSEVRTGSIETMTAEEIRKELERLRQDYADGSIQGVAERVDDAPGATEVDSERLLEGEVYEGSGEGVIVAEKESEDEQDKKQPSGGRAEREGSDWLE